MAFWICVIGLALSLIGLVSTKSVSEFIAPSGPGFWAIPRTIASMLWFTGGGVVCFFLAVIFGLLIGFVV